MASPQANNAVSSGSEYLWPEMHESPGLTGVSNDPAVSASNASQLGVHWMTSTGGQVLSSPVGDYDATLGKVILYIGNESGLFMAVDQATGVPIWSVNLGSAVRTTPVVEFGHVWVATLAGHLLYKLNGATGAAECSVATPSNESIDSSPTFATPPGGVPMVYIGVNDQGTSNGPLLGVRANDCSVVFSATPEPSPGSGGVWDPVSYAQSATGEGLVLFGTANPDSEVYAIDANTGGLVWRFQTDPVNGNFDVGAGVVISPPGNNGFADGVAYVETRYGIMHALDLGSGLELWSYNFQVQTGAGSSSTPALSGTDLVFGTAGGVDDLNALTGQLNWRFSEGDSYPVESSPAIVGPTGSRAVAIETESGHIDVLSLSAGTLLYSYRTGSYNTSSMADVNGVLVGASADSYLYTFSVGGDTFGPPSTTVVSPANGSIVANTGSSVTITGTSAPNGEPVASVIVYLQAGGTSGPWWNSLTSTWVASPYPNSATISDSQGDWTFTATGQTAGGGMEAFASAVGAGGSADISFMRSAPTAARSSFTLSATSGAKVSASGYWVAPGQSVSLTGSGFVAGEQVNFTLGGTNVGKATATSNGQIQSTAVVVPTNDVFGPDTLVASGQTSGALANSELYVLNNWSQYLDGVRRQSTEPNDNVFAPRVSVGPGSYLTRAWLFNSGGSIRSSPSFVNGVVYLANDLGTVQAVSVHSGLVQWSYTDPSGSAIDSSPALSNGELIVGSTSGSVIALNPSNGALLWTASLGAGPIDSSPAISGNRVYLATEGGHLVALNLATGQTVWNATLAGGTRSSPAIDSTKNLAFIGDSAGALSAFAAGSGAQVWSVVTGGPILASPLLEGGSAYVGAGDGKFYSIAEATGTVSWSVQTGGPITASASAFRSTLLFGSHDGILYRVTTGGSVLYRSPTGSAIVGVSSTTGFVVVQDANGSVQAIKPESDVGSVWTTTQGTAMASTPLIADGEMFASSEDGTLSCYTVPGRQPF